MNNNKFRALLVLFAVTACSNDATHPTDASLSGTTSTGTHTDSTGNTGSTSAVAGIRINPRTVTLQVGQGSAFGIYPVDANGVHTVALLAGPVIWRVANGAIAALSDTGPSLKALAAGTTKLYATIGAYKDSATIVVVARTTPPTDSGNTKPPTDSVVTPPHPVATSFVLTTYSFARTTPTTSSDTGTVVQLPGASVSLYRMSANPLVASDSLSVRTLVQTVVSHASGMAVFAAVPNGIYSVTATGTYSGSTVQATRLFGAPGTAT